MTENDIEGDFPEEIFNLTAMEKLYISFNKIAGNLPTKIGELTALREFYAYENEMTGDIPTELGKLIYIEHLVLGKNKFEGEYAFVIVLHSFAWPNVFTSVITDNLIIPRINYRNQIMTGTLPTELNKLSGLKEFSVYSNEDLTGPILDFSKVTQIGTLE